MLKITVDKGETGTLFMLEGGLSGPWVAELHRTVMDSATMPESTHLELSRVNYVDEQGLTLLRDLIKLGVTVQASSPFIKELLKTGS